jgi:hypothetical protein
VVPLIDILLVLLVIFMIIPHQQLGLQASLPQPAGGLGLTVPPETHHRAGRCGWHGADQ